MITHSSLKVLSLCLSIHFLSFCQSTDENNSTPRFSQKLSELRKGLGHRFNEKLETPWPERLELDHSARQPSELGKKSQQLEQNAQTYVPEVTSLPKVKNSNEGSKKIDIKRVPPNKPPLQLSDKKGPLNLSQRFEIIEKAPAKTKTPALQPSPEVKKIHDDGKPKLNLEAMGATPAPLKPADLEVKHSKKVLQNRRDHATPVHSVPLEQLKY